METKAIAIFALEQLLEYAKYLEDNGQLSYDLLSQRVETYKKTVTPIEDMEDRNDDSAKYELHDYAFNGRKIKHGFNHKGEML